MTTLGTRQSVSRRSALAGLGVGGLGVALAASVGHASAQETATDLSAHPLTGTWLAIGNQSTPTTQLAMPSYFGADGSVQLMFTPSQAGQQGVVFQSPLVGTWEASGERRGRFLAVSLQCDAAGAFLGSVTLEGSPVVSEDGQSFLDDGSTVMITVRDPLGNIVQQIPGAGAPPTTAIRMSPSNSGFPQDAGTPATPTS